MSSHVVLCRPTFHDIIIIEKILGGKHRESIFCQPMSVNVMLSQPIPSDNLIMAKTLVHNHGESVLFMLARMAVDGSQWQSMVAIFFLL